MKKAEAAAATSRERALNAALELVGTHGTHALTHGRVDTAAGLPKGSTSNYFRTRATLVHATVDHLVAVERSVFAAALQPPTVEDLVQALTVFVSAATGAHRTLTAARFAFFVEGFHDLQVREALALARHRVETWAARALEELGFPTPFAAAARILAQLDGMILHNLTFGEQRGSQHDIDAVVRSCR